jgi:thiol peroxidase
LKETLMERKGIVTFKGKGLTLQGNAVYVGERAPSFKVLDSNLKEVVLEDFEGKTKLISTTPSLDTPVCDAQARRFEEEASRLSDVVINISMDLPFAISRFCSMAGIKAIKTFSDHRDASFGLGFGILVKELRLLARSVFLIDSDNTIRYIEIVPELTEHPDYDKVFAALRELAAV